MPEALAAALPVVSGIGDAVSSFGEGKGRAPTQVSGFSSYPKEVQDLLLNTILPQITTQANKPYTPLPMRTVNASDYDPVFGSQAVQGLQDYYNQKAEKAKDVTPSTPALPAPSSVTPAGNNFMPQAGSMYQNWKTGSPTQPFISSNDAGFNDYTRDLASAYTNGTPLPSTASYLGGINGLTSSDMAKLKQILSGMGGQA